MHFIQRVKHLSALQLEVCQLLLQTFIFSEKPDFFLF